MNQQKQESAHQPYLNAVQRTLRAALCLQNFGSQKVERHNKPEVESSQDKELLGNTVVIARNGEERVKIETSINSVRVSIGIRKMDEVDELLTKKFMSFLTQRAESFFILRRKAVPNYDISFLITNFHCESMYKSKLVDFIIEFLRSVDAELSEMKISINGRARIVAAEYLGTFR
eukprot:TRINITY_DN14192_c0_g1_i1.p1 TRINITY_DN14192_c0_g1~~TRINITY_DN14192_c0_g1_i1.p1  ORF type:complete len:175 (-),score=35.98 TRINITY_DN14192_c0_g1_i1:72-596(-)